MSEAFSRTSDSGTQPTMNSPGLSSGGGDPSCVSVKSDHSMIIPPGFSSGGGDPSCVSVKSDHSMIIPPGFSSGGGNPSGVSIKSDHSMIIPPGFSSGGGNPSCVSVKSDHSMIIPPGFSSGGGNPSCVSVKSDHSMIIPPGFNGGGGNPSCVSVKSDHSMIIPTGFSGGGGNPSGVSIKSDHSMIIPPGFSGEGGDPSCVFMKSDKPLGHSPLFSREPLSSDQEQTEAAVHLYPKVERTSDLEKDYYQPWNDVLNRVLKRHKTSMKKKYESLFEGVKTQENKTPLNRVYTQLYIIEGESEGVNEEHEVLQMEKPRKHLQDIPINCSDIFKPLEGKTEEKRAMIAKRIRHKENTRPKVQKIRSVLTKGIAGIGKTVSVQKFILDWAEGKANQDVDFMFVLPFRELILIKDDQYSLHGLLCDFHPELRDLDPKIYNELKAVFIFDGLDESRIPLNFEQCEKVSDITMTSSVGVLMTNLIKGELLPSALIWITSRPAAAHQIPRQYINRVTEIQGFNDPQKEEYIKKRISDEDQAKRIILHIKKARSLHIMCHIPVFCWISATVLQRIMKQQHTEIPKTLTEMYSHFLLTQTNMKNEKYEEEEEKDPENLLESNRISLLKLAELAFKQLMKGNVMFYEEDLRESGIDVTEASVYSGIFTEIFREECVLHHRKLYCFVHLSFQEFLAAVYVSHCYKSKNMDDLQVFKPQYREWTDTVPLDELLIGAVDKSLKSKNGHLDLFLRFLLGTSVESNQRLLQGLLIHRHSSSQKIKDYIKKLIKGYDQEYYISTERSINLFLCLSEMNDQSLPKEIHEYLKSKKHSEEKLSPGQCSALACMLLISEEVLDELDLKKYNTSEEGYRRLIPAVTAYRKAILAGCSLTKNSCETLCSALQSARSSLKVLDLSNNDLQDSGVELFSAGLKSPHCKLETLRLPGCNLTRNSCDKLASALQSPHSSLKELDLSNNVLQDSGLELLAAGLKSSYCNLETLRLVICSLGVKTCENLGSALQSENSSLKELDLSNNDLQDSGVELLCAGLKVSYCKLETLRLSGCMVTEKGCAALASALKSNPSHLRELDLTYNHPGESGVKLFSDLLEDPHCTLEKLQVDHGGETRMKPGLRKYACELSLNPDTAHIDLTLSEGRRKAARGKKRHTYPDHPERFERCSQVLSVESLTGRCYWEAECSGYGAAVAVTYRGIGREGRSKDCWLGYNSKSWGLYCSGNSYSAWHNDKESGISDPPSPSSRVGVYLDWAAGTLSFYSVSSNTHTLTHLYTHYSTFTEPLYAGFWVSDESSVCVMEQSSVSQSEGHSPLVGHEGTADTVQFL